jgi:hypothetical protein
MVFTNQERATQEERNLFLHCQTHMYPSLSTLATQLHKAPLSIFGSIDDDFLTVLFCLEMPHLVEVTAAAFPTDSKN